MEYFIIVCIILILVYFGMKSKGSDNSALDKYNSMDLQTLNTMVKGQKLEKIVTDYGKSLAAGTKGIVRPLSLLKNSKDEIIYATIEYIKLSIQHGKLTKQQYDSLSFAITSIDSFVDDEQAEIINNSWIKDDMDTFLKKYGSLSPYNNLPEKFPEYPSDN